MAETSLRKHFAYILLAGIGIDLLYHATRWLYGRLMGRSDSKRQSSGLMKVLMFPDSQVACRAQFTERHGCTSQRCRFSHDPQNSYAQLLQYVQSARQSIDLCVYTITCSELVDVIVGLSKHGVAVRVITDKEQIDAIGSQVGRFRIEGIQVRHNSSLYLMHHKFVVIDGRVLVTGSFNWTRQAIVGNCENLIVTDLSKVVSVFRAEFEKLWQQFDPKIQTAATMQKSAVVGADESLLVTSNYFKE